MRLVTVILLAAFVVGSLTAALIVRDRDLISNNQRQCETLVEGRKADRAAWERIRQYLHDSQPESQRAQTGSFINDVLRAYPKLKCVDHKPQEVK